MSESIKKIIFFVGLGISAIIFFVITNDPANKTDIEEQQLQAALIPNESPEIEQQEVTSEQIAIVDVKGEVKKPGVYEMSLESRVNDVIIKAGGFTDAADETLVNLAQKVQDEMIIIVNKQGEEGEATGSSDSSGSGQKIRINYATLEEIQTLNGIGPSKAQAIIQYREENGLFQTPEDLLQVSGIGEKTLQNFIDQIQIP
ncbi:helix-hairpin-helix domain-containing protein [Oceanobacillus sp. FSL H7-0719]|uniref:helix-hairpin-helix domain-containing protein n=1 Tax=Oceanobacillus sp. FSL H7-0719 TaxID=2954507 RepID=UPI003251DBF1